MVGEWIIFWITAALLIAALICFSAAVIGAYRFGFSLNRMHAAGIGDTLGLLCVVAAVVIAAGFRFDSLKLILLIVFMWFTSPASTHFLAQVEYFNNPKLDKFLRREIGGSEEQQEENSPRTESTEQM